MIFDMNTLIEHWRRPGGAWLGALFALIVSVALCGWAFERGRIGGIWQRSPLASA